MKPLPLGRVRPTGWLRDQAIAQACGITGQLEQIWADVGPDSGWLGGPGDCWERGPYYLDGLVPLAEILDDEELRGKAAKWIEWTLASQGEDGFFGPVVNTDWWPRMVMLNVLLAHHSATGDERVPPFVERYLRYAHDNLPERPLEMWAAARGAEMIPAVLWCHERTNQPWLLDLAATLVDQSIDWAGLYRDFAYTRPAAELPLGRVLRTYLPPRTTWEKLLRRWRPAQRTRPRTRTHVERSNASAALRFYHQTHGVNHAMALRGVAYAALVNGGDPAVEARMADDTLMRFHGSPVGVVVADEHLAGTSAVHGIETCSVVETMRSCEELLRITGQAHWGDRLEQVAFNALPAAMTADTMGHQYYQQVNQIEVSRRWRPWFNGGREGNLFGLEPSYGCCTANLHQGWPKLVASAVLQDDDGLVLATLVPCVATAEIGGRAVTMEVSTDYPFDGQIRVRIRLPEPTRFTVRVRLPTWVQDVQFDAPVEAEVIDGWAAFTHIWRDGDELIMNMPMPVRQESGRDGVVVKRGPLVLCVPLRPEWSARGTNWEVRSDSVWAFGLEPDAVATDVKRLMSGFAEPAVEVTMPVRLVHGWGPRHGSAGPLPRPLQAGDPLDVQMVPYGSTALRMTVFPRV